MTGGNGSCASAENTPSKKRRITGTKRIEFEAAFAKVDQWLSKALEELPQGDSSYENELETEKNLETLRRLEEETMKEKNRVRDTIRLGEELISHIQSESDYPEEYLNNVSDKVQLVRQQMSQLETQVPEMLRDFSYWSKKAQLYANLRVLSDVLHQYKIKLQTPDFTKIAEYKTNLASHSQSLNQLKVLAKETLLHPGAIKDPANTIKADLYTFCENFEALETQFSLLKQGPKADLKDYQDKVEAISLWMEEVSAFLISEDAKFGDAANLQVQVKDSDSLVEDIATLKSRLEEVNSSGQALIQSGARDVSCELQSINDKWAEVTALAKAQNVRLRAKCERSESLMESLDELRSFMTQLCKDLPSAEAVVHRPSDLSQRTFKLLHFKDRIEKKRTQLQLLLQSTDNQDLSEAVSEAILNIQSQWSQICEPVLESYQLMKVASTEYGEFKTLTAQESDWLERLEKKLKRPTHSAADAEEISEELNEIENFLDNHPEVRLRKIRELAEGLAAKDIQIQNWMEDVQKLESRWSDLRTKAKQRTSLLEAAIAEAQEWEYKLIAVQDWLTERDILLTSHLEHELTVDDLPDETQVCRIHSTSFSICDCLSLDFDSLLDITFDLIQVLPS